MYAGALTQDGTLKYPVARSDYEQTGCELHRTRSMSCVHHHNAWPLAKPLKTLSRNFLISRATKSPHAWTMRANWPNLRPSSDGPAVLGRPLCLELHRPKLTRSES